MSEDSKNIEKEIDAKSRHHWMSDPQFECAKFLRDLYYGWHHIQGRRIRPCGAGISYCVLNSLATFDSDLLTRMVVMAHERAIRVELKSAGFYLRIILHYRGKREGQMWERHPTLETALGNINRYIEVQGE